MEEVSLETGGTGNKLAFPSLFETDYRKTPKDKDVKMKTAGWSSRPPPSLPVGGGMVQVQDKTQTLFMKKDVKLQQ